MIPDNIQDTIAIAVERHAAELGLTVRQVENGATEHWLPDGRRLRRLHDWHDVPADLPSILWQVERRMRRLAATEGAGDVWEIRGLGLMHIVDDDGMRSYIDDDGREMARVRMVCYLEGRS